jgi:hypothetical protein
MAGPDLRVLELLTGGKAPAGHDREGRVGMLLDFAEAVLAGREPDRAALLFVAGGLASWLREGGHLTRDYWRTAGRQGCTLTEAQLARRLRGSSRRATAEGEGGTIAASSTAKGIAE